MTKILVTDDSTFMRLSIRKMLEPEGYIICEASNGLEMLSVYEIEKPDIITLDITMPEMDGLEALTKLKATHPEAKVIMCSAMGQQAMVLDAVKKGAVNFLVKPFEKSKVLDAIVKAKYM